MRICRSRLINSFESTRIRRFDATVGDDAHHHMRADLLVLLSENELSKGHKSYIKIKSNSLSSVSSLVSYILDTLLRRKLHFYRRSPS